MAILDSSAYITMEDLELAVIEDLSASDKTLLETENGPKAVLLDTIVQKVANIIEENGTFAPGDSVSDATAVKFVEQVLTDEQKAQARENIDAEKIYISDVEPDVPAGSFWVDTSANSNEEPMSASDVEYDNSGNGLNSTNVQDAIDEIAGKAKDFILFETTQETITINTGYNGVIPTTKPSHAGYTTFCINYSTNRTLDLANCGMNITNGTMRIYNNSSSSSDVTFTFYWLSFRE